jgi:tol-pal system protein YbgF
MLKEKAPTSDPAVPQLPVEVVAPPRVDNGTRVVGVADDGAEIVYEGDAAAGKVATMEEEPATRMRDPGPAPTSVAHERLEVTHHAARAPRSHPRADHDTVPANDSAAGEYRAAVELVKAGKHDDAVAALRAFVKAHPNHDYADNAQYWLGETFYAQKDYQHALVEFRATIETYPSGNKVPDALLKVGYCYQALGQNEKARAVLEQVVNLYPKSEPAALAAKRLETP